MLPTYTFFAVDKGHMTLVQFSNGYNMLMDCRRSPARPSPLEYLKARITTLDLVVITHPHQDHLTGLKEVCEWFKPRSLWHNGRYFKPYPVYDDWSYYEKLRAGNVSFCTPALVERGYAVLIGDSRVYVAAPKTPHLQGTCDDENNNSIILTVTTGASKVVLTGDTEFEQWSALDHSPLENAAIFQASHHGRESGFRQHTMDRVNPQRIVISDGECCPTDASEKYRKIAPISTTRDGCVVVRPGQSAATAAAAQYNLRRA
jgi:competence protein ComEC